MFEESAGLVPGKRSRMIVCLWLTAPRCFVHQLGYLARIFSNNGELVPCFL
jgi:hypothetical protein